MNMIGLNVSVMVFGKDKRGKIVSEEGERVTVELSDFFASGNNVYNFNKKNIEVIIPLDELEKMNAPKKVTCKYCGSDELYLNAYSGGGYGWGHIRCEKCGCTALEFGDDNETPFLNEFIENYAKQPAVKVGGKYEFKSGNIKIHVTRIWNNMVTCTISGDVDGVVEFEADSLLALIK